MPRRGPPEFISVTEAAAYLNVTTRTIRRMIDDGRLTGYRITGSRFIRVDLAEIKAKFKPI